MPHADLEKLISHTPDFPQKGVLFRDISPLLATRFHDVVDGMGGLFTPEELDSITAFAGIDPPRANSFLPTLWQPAFAETWC